MKSKKKNKKAKSEQAPNQRKGRLVEQIAAMMHKRPGVKVECNVFLPPRHGDPERRREIDVLVTGDVAGYEIRIPFECKNEKDPIGVEYIGSFADKLEEVGIPSEQGIYVSSSGYTSGAIDRAKTKGIKLLTLTGLSEDRLSSAISDAFQYHIYLLAQIKNIALTNEIESIPDSDHFLLFHDEEGKVWGTVPDLVWNKWNEGEPPSVIGEHLLEINVPPNWYQLVNGKRVPVISITATIQVIGLMVKLTGSSSRHALLNAEDKSVDRWQVGASFDLPKESGASLPVTTIETEEELKALIEKPASFKITARIRLPRIQAGAIYWPPSERVAKIAAESLNKYKAGELSALEPFDFVEVEGTNLKTVYEPVWGGYQGMGVPVVVTKDDGTTVDLLQLMIANEYDQIIAMRPYFERNPSPAFADLLSWAYLMQGNKLSEIASSKSSKEAERLMERVIEKIHAALEINPNMAEAHDNLGVALGTLGRDEDSLACHERALDINPNYVNAWVNKGSVLDSLERHNEALESYEYALTLAPQDGHTLYNRGCALATLGRYEESIESFDMALKSEPDNPKIWHRRGRALQKLHKYEDAIKNYDQASQLGLEDAELWANRGIALEELNRYDDALESFDQALVIDPQLHECLRHRGSALFSLGRYEEAVSNFERSLAVDSNDCTAWSNKGLALVHLGRYTEALESCERALAVKPGHHHASVARGCALHYLGRHEDALVSFDEALKDDSQDQTTWHRRGCVLDALGRYADAVESFDRALEIDGRDADVIINRAIALRKINRLSEALDGLSELLQNTTEPKGRFLPLLIRADIQRLANQHSQAINDLVSAWEIDSAAVIEDQSLRAMTSALSTAPATSPSFVLICIEMLCFEAAEAATNGNTTEAKARVDRAVRLLEALASVDETIDFKETVSSELVNDVLTRSVQRLMDCNNVALNEYIERMNNWTAATKHSHAAPH
jgi:tetratricopeptide (TPR) repeat protein